ncbi:MAG: trypsin-like peptidase domain-containing protein [Acidimicrobiales bacterium]
MNPPDWKLDPGQAPPTLADVPDWPADRTAITPPPPGVGEPSPFDRTHARPLGPPLGPPPAQPPHRPIPVGGPPPSLAAAGRSRRGPLAAAAVVGGLALFSAGFAAGRVSAPEERALTVPSAVDRPASNTTAPPSTQGAASPSTSSKASGSVSPSTSGVPAGADPMTLSITNVVDKVSPAVVQINTNGGLGSGFIYDSAGYILTAAHVVEGGGSQVKVRLKDGVRVDGQVLGLDQETDVAVVKIPGRSDLPVAQLGLDRQPRVGEIAVAIGSPYGLDQTVTSGIVSAVNRPVPTGGSGLSGRSRIIPMVQTDAAINSGNSGGALVNGQGQVIGINDQIRTTSGGNDGIGFAIPIELAKKVADAIVAGREPQYPQLGVEGDSTASSSSPGAPIARVTPGGPADLAGLRAGDLITAIEGQAIRDFSELAALLRLYNPGESVKLDVTRGGSDLTLTAALTAR